MAKKSKNNHALLIGIAAIFLVGFFLYMATGTGCSRSVPKEQFVSAKPIPAYPYKVPLPEAQYNSMTTFKSQLKCEQCFYYGIMSAQADALYAISVGKATQTQSVLLPTIQIWNAYSNSNGDTKVTILPVQLSLLNAAARIYGSNLRGNACCGANCADTNGDNMLWLSPTSVQLAQLWAAAAMHMGTATPTQTMLYNAMCADVPTAEQKALLEYTSQQVAIADASMMNPNIAQVTLIVAASAVARKTATLLQISYYTNATPYLVSQFNSAIVAQAGNVATADQLALLATLPPPIPEPPRPLPPMPLPHMLPPTLPPVPLPPTTPVPLITPPVISSV